MEFCQCKGKIFFTAKARLIHCLLEIRESLIINRSKQHDAASVKTFNLSIRICIRSVPMPTTSEGFLQMVRLQQLQLEQQQNAIIFANRYIFPSTDDIGVDNGNGSGSGNDNGDINDGSGCASRSAVGFGVGVGVSRQSSVGRPYAKKGNWFVVLNGFNDIPAQFVLPWVRIDVVRCICNVNFS
jgi:hypothetical protein